LFIIFFLSFAGSTSATQAFDQLAINQKDNTCGIYNAGDEFSQRNVPAGWTIYSGNDALIDYSVPDAQTKCSKLGYKYIDDIFAATTSATINLIYYFIAGGIILIGLLVFLVRNRKKRRK
jgi:hypothetical protein